MNSFNKATFIRLFIIFLVKDNWMFVCLSVCLSWNVFFLWKMFILGRIQSIHLSMHSLILHSVIFSITISSTKMHRLSYLFVCLSWNVFFYTKMFVYCITLNTKVKPFIFVSCLFVCFHVKLEKYKIRRTLSLIELNLDIRGVNTLLKK